VETREEFPRIMWFSEHDFDQSKNTDPKKRIFPHILALPDYSDCKAADFISKDDKFEISPIKEIYYQKQYVEKEYHRGEFLKMLEQAQPEGNFACVVGDTKPSDYLNGTKHQRMVADMINHKIDKPFTVFGKYNRIDNFKPENYYQYFPK